MKDTKNEKYIITLRAFPKYIKAMQIPLPYFGNHCLCCNTHTDRKQKMQLAGSGTWFDYYAGKTDVPVCSDCKTHLYPDYWILLGGLTIFLVIFSIVVFFITDTIFHFVPLFIFLLTVIAMVILITKEIKTKKIKSCEHYPDFMINASPETGLMIVTKNLKLAKGFVDNHKHLEIEYNDALTKALKNTY